MFKWAPKGGEINEAVFAYLERRYPGIKDHCTGYSVVRKTNGEVLLMVSLLTTDEDQGHG